MEKTGKDGVVQLKRDNYNLELEKHLVNAKAERLVKVIDGHIVPDAGYVFLSPVTHNGRAPFYSSEKIVGNLHIRTLWFNLGIMLLMCDSWDQGSSNVKMFVITNNYPYFCAE